jgi:hypothetical protein
MLKVCISIIVIALFITGWWGRGMWDAERSIKTKPVLRQASQSVHEKAK